MPALRVRIPTDSIELLDEAPDGAYLALSVPDPDHHDLELRVQYKAGPTAEDAEDIASLGGRVVAGPSASHRFIVELPDSSIPALEAKPNVEYVANPGGACGNI